MNEKIRDLLAQITALEDEIEDILRIQQENILFYLKDGRIKFREEVEDTHRKLKIGLFRWFLNSRPRNLLSAPFIYAMIIPFVFLDICLSIYQWTCFPLYRIGRVRRDRYIILDRHNLKHLNSIERFNCVYCGYANGLLGYAREIAARTEQYWCPIKHARKVLDKHLRYHEFIDFGDAEDFQQRVKGYRRKLVAETRKEDANE